MESANAATTALISGSVDAALSGPGEVVAAQARGQQVLSVANSYRGLSGSLVLSEQIADGLDVSADAALEDRLRALDGLTIASPSATAVYTAAFRTATAAVGAHVNFVYMAQPAMLAALESGAVQGFVGGAPFWAVPVAEGSGVLWIAGPRGEMPENSVPAVAANLQMMRSVIEADPQLAQDLVAVFAELGQTIEAQPDEVRAAVTKLYPDVEAKTMDLLFDAESPAWNAGRPTAESMARDIAFMKASGSSIKEYG